MAVTCWWPSSYVGDGSDSDGYEPVVKVERCCSGCVGNVILVMLNVGCFYVNI